MMKSRIDQFKKVMVIMAGLLLVASSSHAQTITAIGNGIWNDVNSWDCACIPGPNNDAVIGAAFSINVSGDVTINSLTIMATALFTVYDTFRVQTNVLITGGFVSYGIVHIAGDITNNGALQGPGTYCVAGVSTNGSTGTMLGDMDFCDLTPPMTTPFVDNNSGFIQANVDFCLNGLCGATTNNPPVNTLDTANTTTEEYTPIEICIASTDADGDAIDVTSIVNGPSNGTISGLNNADTCFTYSPGLNFTGTDVMSAVVCDVSGDCDTTIVVITVTTPVPAGLINNESENSDVEVTYGHGVINVALTFQKYSNVVLELVDLRGRVVWTAEISGNENSLKPADNLKGGMYLYRITDSDVILDQGKLLLK